MPSRQARRERRAAERKAKKHLLKQNRPNTLAPTLVPPPCSDDEFTPEFIAYANGMRERVARRVGTDACVQPTREHGFVSQPPPAPDKPPAEEPPPPTSKRVDEPAILSDAKTQTLDEPALLSEAKTRRDIYRANAQQSTGHRSPTGKLASSRNSLKQGLAAGTLIIHGEDQTAFDALLNDLLAEHQPANTTEEMLIHEIAQSFWLVQRALRFQNECFTDDGVDEKRLALFLRYQTTHERAFHKALSTLMRLQKDRRKTERKHERTGGFVAVVRDSNRSGFVSHPNASEETETGFVSQNPPLLAPQPPFVRQSAPPLAL